MKALLSLLVLSSVAGVAPPPREPESVKMKRVWGDLIDADKDCTFSPDGEKLKILVPAKSHIFRTATHNGGQGQADNAPRTSRTVTGDFTLTVQFVHTAPVEDPANANTFAGAGVYVFGGQSCSAITLHHTAGPGGAVATAQYRIMGRKPNSSTSGGRNVTADEARKPNTVKVVREGNKVTMTYSTDAKKWNSLWSYEGDFPAEVTVGVFAENAGGKGYEATFEGLKIETPDMK